MDQPSELREVSLDAHTDPVPEPVGLATDHHVSVPAGIPLILVQVGVPGAGPGFDAFVKTVPANIKVEDFILCFGAAHLAELTFAGKLISPVKGSKQSVGSLLTGTEICEPYTGPGGVAALPPGELILGKAGVVDKRVGAAAKGFQGPLTELGHLVFVRAPGSAHGNITVNQPRHFLAKIPVSKADAVHVARGHLIDNSVTLAHNGLVNCTAFFGLEINGYGFLSPHLVKKVEPAFCAGDLAFELILFPAKGRELSQGVASGRLHFDHLGPGFAEQSAAKHVAHSPLAATDKLEPLESLGFAPAILIPEVVLTPLTEVFRLALGIRFFHNFFKRWRRCDRPGPDLRIHQVDCVCPAVYFNVSFFCHILPPKSS